MKLAYIAVFAFFHIASSRIRGELLNDPKCDVAGDAVLSNCIDMLEAVGNINLNWDRTCSYDGDLFKLEVPPGAKIGRAYNPFCFPGNCCLYTDRLDAPLEEIKKWGRILTGKCGNEQMNTVNGRVIDDDGYQYCLSARKGCGDCFH